jgi:hypothetical protein
MEGAPYELSELDQRQADTEESQNEQADERRRRVA